MRLGMTFERLEDRRVLAGVIMQADPGYFDTWNGGLILSTDPAGIAFEPSSLSPPGHLYIADSEIDETPQFQGDNIFEISLDGQQLFREIASNNDEPTGAAFETGPFLRGLLEVAVSRSVRRWQQAAFG